MRLIEAEQKILALKQPILLTRDVSACLNIPLAQASKMLERLSEAERCIRIMRGKWAFVKGLDPLTLPEYLTAPFPSYISLQSALFYHGLISQIPNTIYAVSMARAKQYKTPLANFSIHHIDVNFFFGFETIGGIKIASPEKALIDILYLAPARSAIFKKLPEIEIPDTFNMKQGKNYISKIPSDKRRALVQSRFDYIISNQNNAS